MNECEIICISGEAGCGKTTLLSVLIHDDVTIYNLDAYTNYNHKDAHIIKNVDEFKSIHDGVIGIDESYLEFDSKRGMSNRNIIWSQILYQRRKMGVTRFYYTLPQHLDEIPIADRRIRVATNVEMQPRYEKQYDILYVKVLYPSLKNAESWYFIENVIERYGYLFDTYELHEIGTNLKQEKKAKEDG